MGDISYTRTRQGFLYLAFVLDLASRRVLGVSMAPHLKTSLATDALREAIGTRGGQMRGVVFHSDRGSPHTSRATAQLCRAYGVAQSVGRTGVCWDNAAAESFLGTLKTELVNRADYQSRHHARLSIRYWIQAWYNPRRLHSTIGQQPPNEWEDNYYHHTAAYEPPRVSRRLYWLGDNGVMGRLMMYSPEVRERAVRMVLEHRGEHRSEWAAICSIAEKFGCSSETLRKWVRRAETDQGLRPGLSSDQLAELKELRRENRELRRANEILRKASAYFAQAELDRRPRR